MRIRPFHPNDTPSVIQLWNDAGLVTPQNDPKQDIELKLQVHPELFLVGELGGEIIATCMAGYEGHRGWINYLAVTPRLRAQGYARAIMQEAEQLLAKLGCPKINLQVRSTNVEVIEFYKKLGYTDDSVVSLGKRLNIKPD